MEWQLIKLGRSPYQETLAEQFRLRDLRLKNEIVDTVLMVEHPRVITQGRRPSEEDFLVSKNELVRRGFGVEQVNRGGKLTYHGPGQLVVYFVVSLRERGWKIPQFVHLVEEIVIRTLANFEIKAGRRHACPGVWLQEKKIASIGLAVNRGVSMHGFALNINPDLNDFKVINPCGIQDCQITSVYLESKTKPTFQDVQKEMEKVLESVFAKDQSESATNSARSFV